MEKGKKSESSYAMLWKNNFWFKVTIQISGNILPNLSNQANLSNQTFLFL